jgi:hypothetical protein
VPRQLEPDGLGTVNRYLIRPERRWKGTANDWLVSDTIGADCGYPLQVGREYLMFATVDRTANTSSPTSTAT